MDLRVYQERTQATAKTFKEKVIPLEDLRSMAFVFESSLATTGIAGVFKKNIFHGHEKPFDMRVHDTMLEYVTAMNGKNPKPIFETRGFAPIEQCLLEGVLGAVDEMGEVAEIALPLIRGEQEMHHIAPKLKDELGDVMWYLARIAKSAGLELADIAAANIAKLEARYPSGFSQDASLNRDDSAEKAAVANTNSNPTQEVLLKALVGIRSAMDQTIMDAKGNVALKGSQEDVAIIQKAYDDMLKAMEVVMND